MGDNTTCKKCGAKTLWIKTTRGKYMMCERELVSEADLDIGDIIITPEGDTVKLKEDTASQRRLNYGLLEGHVPIGQIARMRRTSGKN